MKNRKREICTSGTVRDEDGNVLIYSANERGDRGNVGIIRSPNRAGADRAAVLGQRLGGGASLGGDQVADGLAGKTRLAGRGREAGIEPRAASGGGDGDHGEQLVTRAGDEELKLAVLVDRAERCDGCRTGALLAETFRPQLHVPAGEAFQPIRIG
jgi:hypothetical protein